MLTPNLTLMQHGRLQEALSRMTGLSLAPRIYADADRIAGRYMLETHLNQPTAAATTDFLVAQHGVSADVAAYIAGMALGLRLGRSFGRQGPEQRRRTVTDDYARLDPELRRSVGELIRRLARGRFVMTLVTAADVATETPGEAPGESDLEAARRWTRQASLAARASR